MSETQPKITIIVTVFNGKSTLERCLNSVASQTYTHKELIVIDGGSSDGTVDILKANAGLMDYWESKKDRGIYHGFNKGVNQATGDWIMFLGADDYLSEDQVLEKVAERLLQIEINYYVVYCQVNRVSQDNKSIKINNESWSRTKNPFRYYRGNVDHQGVLHHKDLFEKYGLFDESFQISGDYELLLRHLANHDAYFLDNIILSARQSGGVSDKINNRLKAYKEDEKARKNKQLNSVMFLLFTPYRFYFYLRAIVRFLLFRAGQAQGMFFFEKFLS